MSAQRDYANDVFISYNHADQQWVWDELWPRLERAGLKVIDDRDFEIGVPRLINMERAIEQSRKVLLVLTPNWVTSEWAHFDALLAQTGDISNSLHRTLPLILEPCEIPKRIAILTHADFTTPATREREMARLLRGLGTKA